MPNSLRKTERMQSFITASSHKKGVSFRSLQIKGDTFFFYLRIFFCCRFQILFQIIVQNKVIA